MKKKSTVMCQVCSPIRHVDIDRLKFLCSGRWWCIPLIFSSRNYITNYGKSSYMELKNKIKEFFFSWKKKPIVRIIEADRITAGPNNRDSPSAQPISLSLQQWMPQTNCELLFEVRTTSFLISSLGTNWLISLDLDRSRRHFVHECLEVMTDRPVMSC